MDYKACCCSRSVHTNQLTAFQSQQGKKKVQAVSRAIRNAQKSPRPPLPWKNSSTTKRSPPNNIADPSSPSSPFPSSTNPPTSAPLERAETQSIRVPSRHRNSDSQDSNYTTSPGGTRWRRYGSIVGSPVTSDTSRPRSLNLGEPALDTNSDDELLRYANRDHTKRQSGNVSQSPSAFEVRLFYFTG